MFLQLDEFFSSYDGFGILFKYYPLTSDFPQIPEGGEDEGDGLFW